MLLAKVYSELRFTPRSPFVCAVIFPTCETGSVTVYLFAVALEALLLRKRFMSGTAITQEGFTRTCGRYPFFRLFTSLCQISVPKQIEGPHNLPGIGNFHCVASNHRRFPDWRRTVTMN
jgi:hypothetical protein